MHIEADDSITALGVSKKSEGESRVVGRRLGMSAEALEWSANALECQTDALRKTKYFKAAISLIFASNTAPHSTLCYPRGMRSADRCLEIYNGFAALATSRKFRPLSASMCFASRESCGVLEHDNYEIGRSW